MEIPVFCKTTLAFRAIAEIHVSSCFWCTRWPIAIIIVVSLYMRNTLILCFVSNLISIIVCDFQKLALSLDWILVFLMFFCLLNMVFYVCNIISLVNLYPYQSTFFNVMFLHWLMVPMCTNELSTFPSYQYNTVTSLIVDDVLFVIVGLLKMHDCWYAKFCFCTTLSTIDSLWLGCCITISLNCFVQLLICRF